jgi:hypothetical protein
MLKKSLLHLVFALACTYSFLFAPCEGFSRGLPSGETPAEPPKVLYTEGLLHGFLVLRSLAGQVLADGEFTQWAHGDRVTIRLVFHFKDTSFYEENVIFYQRRVFHLLSYHLTQKGPAFKPPMEFSLDGMTGQATVRYTDDEGKEKTESERMKIQPDLANGLLTTLVKDIPPKTAEMRLSLVIATPKSRLVKLVISDDGEDWFSVGISKHKATRYRVKFEITGVAGVLVPLVGKQPPDVHIWVLNGEAPVFLKSEGPLYSGVQRGKSNWPARFGKIINSYLGSRVV